MSTNNTLLFACAYCKSDIESDSLFCDQCGKEIWLCENCHLPGRGQWCEEDGGALIAAQPQAQATSTVRFDNAHKPLLSVTLKLVNANLGLSLDIQHDSILGRTTGPYVAQVGTLTAISGKHIQFRYDVQQGWSFQDMGSSNGTKYSKSNKAWQNEPKALPNISIALEDKAYLLIANVEFAIHIEGHSPASTQRI